MPRKIRPVLQEMLTAINGIETAIAGKDFADFQREWLLREPSSSSCSFGALS